MAKEREKFIKRQDAKRRALLRKIVQDILDWKMKEYDCIPMEWLSDYWRVKCDNIRIIVYKDSENEYAIKKIGFRWWVYNK